MSDFEIVCPRCRETLLIDQSAIGASVTCPSCQYQFLIAAPVAPQPQVRIKPKPKTGKCYTGPLIGIGSFVVFVIFLNIYANWEPSRTSSAPTAPAAKPAAEMTSFDWAYDSGSGLRSITGTVHNNCATELPLVIVEFALLDESKAQVGTAHDTISRLAPNADWNFRALVLEKSAKSARPLELRGKWY